MLYVPTSSRVYDADLDIVQSRCSCIDVATANI